MFEFEQVTKAAFHVKKGITMKTSLRNQLKIAKGIKVHFGIPYAAKYLKLNGWSLQTARRILGTI